MRRAAGADSPMQRIEEEKPVKRVALFVVCIALTGSVMAAQSFPTDNSPSLSSSPAAFSCGSPIELTLSNSTYDGADVTVTVVNATNGDHESVTLNQITRLIPPTADWDYNGSITSFDIDRTVGPNPDDGVIQCSQNDLLYVTYDENSELELAMLTGGDRETTSTPGTNDIFGSASPDPVDCGADVTVVVFDLSTGVASGTPATLQWTSAETESVTFAQDEFLTGGAGIYSQVYSSGLTGTTSDGSVLCTNPGTVVYEFTSGGTANDTETISGQNFVPVELQSFSVE